MFKGMFNDSSFYGVLSLLIFFTVFVIAMIMVVLKKKSDVEYMANLPLDDNEILDQSKKN